MESARIAEPYIYGYALTHGKRKAEIIQAYEGQWLVFRYLNGAMLRELGPSQYMSYQEAREKALGYLKQRT